MKHMDMLWPLFTRLYHCHTGNDAYDAIFDELCRVLELDGITLVLVPPDVSWRQPQRYRCFDGGACYRPLSELQPLLYQCHTRLTARHWFCSLRVPGDQCCGALAVTLKGGVGELTARLRWLALQLSQWQLHFWQLSQWRAHSRCLEQWANLSDRPQLMVADDGTLLFANQSALALLRLGTSIRQDDAGQLLLRGQGTAFIHFGRMLAGRGEGQQVIRVPDTFQVVHLVHLPDCRYWLVMIKDPGLPARLDIECLACLFSLTRTEKAQLLLLASGCCANKRIAQRRHVSPETAKTVQQSIYRKTGCRSRGELLLLLQAMS
ncbi:hypothetical protein CGX12_09580 [Zobellella denitrificans]|jgi:DNA-binding CsgD family transcriptional regulator|uniref:Uncharacterized protein n=1 Tax=Zobellella denitrificans TaxID=347534 RepID=A0A231MYN8_9GAMM|nr:helix-turn-helix transcriptional regulator [Zobellella denitrificans]ATG73850.1 hypothetical protein AN401_08225 [Zobellella denitrificans]OXS15351.1 hypothetical protein CGX12_09580 [Zobellella denitrificans]